ncbi:hypothetical protein IC235_02140 [Hymenobacter sp. BT664]|uniref:Uncharacterized protein n=1 Tax=Hymenobacter montanus TaxID=2771359 RepID=A0A927GHR5_9BACT|nr:hypothetical protein [Hymenobacter montanus]MBD2766688.1 hypothetical protein [Hymenobacter montanus]
MKPYLFLLTTITHKTTISHESLSGLDLIKTLIPVLLFFAGILFNRLLERIRERKRLNDLEEYFITVCQLVNNAANRQVKAILETAKVIKQFKAKNFMIPQVPAFNLDEILAISKTDLYKIFVRNRNGKPIDNIQKFHNLINCIHFYHSAIKTIARTDDETLKIVSSFREKWNSSLSLAMNEINHMILKAEIDNIKPGQDSFLDEIQTIIRARKAKSVTLQQEDTIDNIHNEFVLPILRILLSHKNERSIKLLPFYTNMNSEFVNLQKFRASKSSYLANTARSLQHVRMDLKKILNTYKDVKRKSQLI